MSEKPTFTPEIEALLEMKVAYEAKVKDLGAKALGQFIKPFLDRYPSVTSIRWHQYTPYFNDGDECKFSVNKPEFGLTNAAATSLGVLGEAEGREDEDDEVKYYSGYAFGKYQNNDYNKKVFATPEGQDLYNALREIHNAIGQLTDLCKSAFGDHAQVTIFRDKVEVEEYDHD